MKAPALPKWFDRMVTLAAIVLVVMVGSRYLAPRASDPLEALSEASVAPPGRVSLVELGATYCPSCVAMTPIVELLKRSYAGRAEVSVLLVDRAEHRQAVEPIARLAQLRYTPTFLVIGRDGRATAKFIGPASYLALSKALDEALGQQTPRSESAQER